MSILLRPIHVLACGACKLPDRLGDSRLTNESGIERGRLLPGDHTPVLLLMLVQVAGHR